jgi:F-box and WD-40 domain protein 10
VWSIGNKKETTVFKHKYPVVSVAINNDICVTGGLNGKIKVFQISSKICLKVSNTHFSNILIKKQTFNLFISKSLQAHKGIVSGIKLDKWHIVTCGTDGFALVYSTQGKHDKCLMAMRHPK